jgi:hypothetical protein
MVWYSSLWLSNRDSNRESEYIFSELWYDEYKITLQIKKMSFQVKISDNKTISWYSRRSLSISRSQDVFGRPEGVYNI